MDDEVVSMEAYKGKVLLLVNTASKCGFTPQYKGLEALNQKYQSNDFEIIGFPSNQFLEQEPGTKEEIKSFCELNYGVTFELSQKIDVRGENADPLFKYLTSETPFEGYDLNSEGGAKMQGFLSEKLPHLLEGNDIKWNFTKFLIDKEGNVVKRYESPIAPEEIEKDIEKLL
jgi:glutathione peroxidase